jgi:phosphatidate cytidylyltransferase
MSIQSALESSIFQFYALAMLGLLACAGVTIALLRWPQTMDHAWRSYLGWLMMVPLVIGAIFLGRFAAVTLLTLISIFGFKEFARATGLYSDFFMTGVVYAGIIALGITCLMTDPNLQTPGWYGLFIVMPVYVIAAIMMVPILRNRTAGQLQTMALAILGFIYIGWMFGHLSFLTNATHAYGYLLYLLVAVSLNDVAAYTCGRLFGRHPLRSEISPKKTWEGSIGALIFSMIFPWIMWFSLPDFTPRELILTGLIVGIGGQVGDLAISVIKRDVGIKDTGALIKGHGGILDRIDSLIFTTPLFFHMISFFHPMQ